MQTMMVAWIDDTSGMIVFTMGAMPKVHSFTDNDANSTVCVWKRYGIEESTGKGDLHGKPSNDNDSRKIY